MTTPTRTPDGAANLETQECVVVGDRCDGCQHAEHPPTKHPWCTTHHQWADLDCAMTNTGAEGPLSEEAGASWTLRLRNGDQTAAM